MKASWKYQTDHGNFEYFYLNCFSSFADNTSTTSSLQIADPAPFAMTAQLPTKMKAILLKEFHKGYELAEIDVPTPKPHQVLVKIAAGGFCHTDCMIIEHEFTTTLPLVGSHEPAGTVVVVGSGVTEFNKGDRVGCINFDSCCGKVSR